MFTAEAPKGKEATVRMMFKTGSGTLRDAGELKVRFKAVSTEDVDRLAEDNALASEVFDEVVEWVGPVGHPTEKDDAGNPKPLPDDEALKVVRNHFEAMQHVVNAFWRTTAWTQSRRPPASGDRVGRSGLSGR